MKKAKVTKKLRINLYIVFALLSFFFVIPKIVYADNISLPGLDHGNEHRQWVNLKDKPWRIVGRVQTELGQKCTGFFITPKLIVTAAHCLWLKKTNRPISVRSVHFLWGYQRGHYIRDIKVKQILINKDYGYQPKTGLSLNEIVKDKAYLVVDGTNISPKDILPLKSVSLSIHETLWLGGYEQDKKEVFQVDSHCKISKIIQVSDNQYVIEHDCEATFGSSGSPLLILDSNNQWSIVGVQIAAFTAKKGGLANLMLQLTK